MTELNPNGTERTRWYKANDCPDRLVYRHVHLCKPKADVCMNIILAGTCPMKKTYTPPVKPKKGLSMLGLEKEINILKERVERLERWNL